LTPLNETQYYWRVAGINLFNHQGPWSVVRRLTVDTTPPSAPILISPADTLTTAGTPKFSWKAAPTASLYQLQVTVNFNPSDLFTNPFYASDWTRALTLTPPWLEAGTYHWRVCARDAAGNPVKVDDTPNGSCSPSRSLTILPLTPGSPKLISPPYGSTVASNTPTLTWKAVAYGNVYRVQISTSPTFTAAYIEKDTNNNPLPAKNTSYQAGALSKGKHYWRVIADNIDGTGGAWSAAWSFTVP
jgi:hypothetical protein